MKSILMSIKPKHCANILNGLKTKEIRKRFPKEYRGWIYIYCTKDKELLHKNCANIYWLEDKDFRAKNKRLGIETQPYLNGKVVARFYCDNVEEMYYCDEEYLIPSCLNIHEMFDYLKDKNGYAINISKLEIFDTPKELSEFNTIKEEEIKIGCPLKCKYWCITNYECKYFVEDTDYGGQLTCMCPTKKEIVKKQITKSPQSWCYCEVEE